MYSLLIVDDEEKICKGLVQNVDWKSVGIKDIYVANNAEKAMQMLKENRIDIVITDVKMPRQTGLSMIEKAKQLNGNIHFIVISAYSEFEYAQAALNLRAEAYLLKPINIPELLKTVRNILHLPAETNHSDTIKVHSANASAVEGQEKYSPLVQKCMKYITDNYYKPITLNQISEALERSPSYISHIFRVETGMVITDYLTSLRLKKARKLMQNSNLMLYEIAQMVGYNDYRQFYRAFKKQYGQLPKSGQINRGEAEGSE